MGERDFREMTQQLWSYDRFLCTGLDTDFDKLPPSAVGGGTMDSMLRFNQNIIEAVWQHCGFLKPNLAFYLQHGPEGLEALRQTIRFANLAAPGLVVILDMKAGDIGNTSEAYAKFAFEYMGADAVTVSPYLGGDAIAPFLRYANKGVFVLCRTSNPQAHQLQGREVVLTPANAEHLYTGPGGCMTGEIVDGETRIPLYQYVAHMAINHWNANGNCGVVVGATYPEEMGEVRHIVGGMPILIPGIGKQGGNIGQVIANGRAANGGMVINVSSDIIYASSIDDYAIRAGEKAAWYHREITRFASTA